ncbi:hypothetical protein [Pseudomonas putida]|uniref:Lipoprotein n=1 Tax=Pseudomonas putida TaxID=303 RepID=A0A6I6XY30_PSEPU|nr:hypothetical protein [Pseudomonas putida]QHG64917.1 hypothetical protein C2H86_11025 [Pseudomonas putida]
MKRVMFASLLFFLLVEKVLAVGCGEAPPVSNTALQASLKGEAEVLFKQIGSASLDGAIEKSKTEIFSKYPDAEKSRTNAFYQWQICVLIMDDKTMSTSEKIKTVNDVYDRINKIDPVPDASKGVDPQSSSGSTKSLSDIPYGTKRSDVDRDGKWESEKGVLYFYSVRNFLGFKFDSYTKFVDDVAESTFLTLKKEFYTSFWVGPTGVAGKRVEEGDDSTVKAYCYGERYERFMSNILGALGATVAPVERDEEDRSGELTPVAGWCSSSSYANCTKVWKSSYRTERFKNGVEFVRFKAALSLVRKQGDWHQQQAELESNDCNWYVTISTKEK